MVDKTYSFDNGFWPVVDGYRIPTRLEVYSEIVHLLSINGYTYHPLSRPPIPLLVNYKDVPLKSLITFLHRVYDYCVLFPTPCLIDVKLDFDGVHELGEKSRCVVIEECADGYFNNYPVPLRYASFHIDKFFSRCDLLNKFIVIR